MLLKNVKVVRSFRWMSMPLGRHLVVLLGVLVALLIAFFSLHASGPAAGFAIAIPENLGHSVRLEVDAEHLQVSAAPRILVYDKHFELILSTDPGLISPYEKEHLDRLLNICELLLTNDETTIYWLDK